MSPLNKPGKGSFGSNFLKDIYDDSTVETQDPQPIYILHRDTIKAFLYEKISLFGLGERVLAWIGIEISVIASLCTADFRPFWIFSAPLLKGVFVVSAFFIGWFLIRDGLKFLETKGQCEVDKLATELGKKGSEIKPKKKESE